MCVIAYQPEGLWLSDEEFENCWRRNPDGGGMAYLGEDGKLTTYKGFFDGDQMLEKYTELRTKYDDSPFVLHFRIATVGAVGPENCHPFWINDDMVMFHNGTIRGIGDKAKSDSMVFATEVLASLPDGWDSDPTQTWLIEQALDWSRVAILHRTGDVTIYNEDKGKWSDEGLWFSNSSFETPKSMSKGGQPRPVQQNEFYLDENENMKSALFNYDYEGEDCSYCDTKMDVWDCEAAEDANAVIPVCMNCLYEHEDQLVDDQIIDPRLWFGVPGNTLKDDDTPATLTKEETTAIANIAKSLQAKHFGD